MRWLLGKFRLDILARDLNSDRVVAIENQLEATDHSHLGQLITYAAKYEKAGIGIWISKQIADEHRAAIDFLNKQPGWDFFGVELKLLKIDDSLPAPFFDIVVEPNHWKKTNNGSSINAWGKNLLYQEVWQILLEKFKAECPGVTNATKGPAQSWLSIPSGFSGLAFQWVFKGNERFVIELYIDFSGYDDHSHRKSKNEEVYNKLEMKRDEIEKAMGLGLLWEQLPDNLSCRIGLERQNISVQNFSDDLYAYAIDKMKLFRNTLLHEIRKIL